MFEAVATGPKGSKVVSGVYAWQDFDPGTMNRRNVDKLVQRLTSDGWEAQPKGSEWFAYRFRKRPVGELPLTITHDSEQAIPMPQATAPHAYPTGEIDEICEVHLDRVAGSTPMLQFRAVVSSRPPGRTTEYASEPWNEKGLGRKLVAENQLRSLVKDLEENGWIPTTPGGEWYSRRFRRRKLK